MFCPKCGAKNSIEQKFCRMCGLGLEGSAISLREQMPELADSELERQEASLERFGSVAFIGFGVVVLAGVGFLLYQIIQKLIVNSANPAGGIYLMVFLVFALLALTYVIRREMLNDKRKKLRKADTQTELKEPNPNLLPDPIFEPVASVVEGTTELLDIKHKTSKLD